MTKLADLPAEFRAQQQQYLTNAKAYTCKSTAAIKSGLVKGAAVWEMAARRVEAALQEDAKAAALLTTVAPTRGRARRREGPDGSA